MGRLRIAQKLIHPCVGDLHRDVVVVELGEVLLGVQELQNVGVMNVHHPHVGAPAEGPLLDGVGRLAEGFPERDRSRRRPTRALDVVAGGTQLVESKPGPAAGLLDDGRVLDGIKDVIDAVPHRQDEACAEHAHLPAGIHQRRAVGHEPAADHQFVETLLPLVPLFLRRAVDQLDVGHGPGHPGEKLLRRLNHPARLILLQVAGPQDTQGVLAQRRGRATGGVLSNPIESIRDDSGHARYSLYALRWGRQSNLPRISHTPLAR
jgi:hypothetical protein